MNAIRTGNFLLDKDISVTIVFIYNRFTKLTNRSMLCHDSLVKFKTNRY